MVFSSLVHYLGEQLYAVNPSLLKVPPEQVGSDQDICYLGPNGEDDPDLVRYCGDLDHGMRGNVGSWYLSPQRHVAEGLLALIVFGYLLWKVQPQLKEDIHHTSQTMKHPIWMKPMTAFCMTMILIYKSCGHENKLFYLVMPCNMEWIVAVFVCIGGPHVQAIALELFSSFLLVPMVALQTPDTADCVLWGEAPFFFFNHYVLLFIPLAYVYNGSITMRDGPPGLSLWYTHFLWWLTACAYFGLFYFVFVALLLSPLSGLNLNYMSHPPPNQDVFEGEWYRFKSSAVLAFIFALSRFILWCLEWIMIITFGPRNKNNSASKLEKEQ